MKTATVLSRCGALALLTLGTGLVEPALAGCGQIPASLNPTAHWLTPGAAFGGGRFMKVGLMRVADEASAAGADSDWSWSWDVGRAPIVGLWSFKYLSEGNEKKPQPINFKEGTKIDGGNTIWFADGNEITYSGVRDPTTGATCLGIWKRTGEYTYELNHIGLSWNPPDNPQGAPVGFGGPAFIKQHVTLAKDGNSYTGNFTISQLLPDGKTLATPAVITGKIVATRVTMDTTTQLP